MIWPPFTVLILKNTRRPVTVRITGPVFVLMAILGPAVFCAAGFSLSRLLPGGNSGFISAPSPSVMAAKAPGSTTAPRKTVPDIGGVFVSHTASGEIEVAFIPANMPSGGVCHAWIIANPDGDPEAAAIHPRSPMFHGLPVDYRNGESFMPADGRKVTIVAEDIPGDILLEGIRVLIYSSEGTVLIDKRLPLDNSRGM